MRYRKRKIRGRTVSEHRYLMEQHLGRKLIRAEVVHHRNGDKLDNRLSNLEVLTHEEHAQHHLKKHSYTKRCGICGRRFTPHPTKRARAVTCSRKCFGRRMSQVAIAREARRREQRAAAAA